MYKSTSDFYSSNQAFKMHWTFQIKPRWSVYDYLDEFQYLNWSFLCTGESSTQLKIVEPHNLLILELKMAK